MKSTTIDFSNVVDLVMAHAAVNAASAQLPEGALPAVVGDPQETAILRILPAVAAELPAMAQGSVVLADSDFRTYATYEFLADIEPDTAANILEELLGYLLMERMFAGSRPELSRRYADFADRLMQRMRSSGSGCPGRRRPHWG